MWSFTGGLSLSQKPTSGLLPSDIQGHEKTWKNFPQVHALERVHIPYPSALLSRWFYDFPRLDMCFRSLEGNACSSLLITHLRIKMQMFTSPCYPETQRPEVRRRIWEKTHVEPRSSQKKHLRNYDVTCLFPEIYRTLTSYLQCSLVQTSETQHFFSSAHIPIKKKHRNLKNSPFTKFPQLGPHLLGTKWPWTDIIDQRISYLMPIHPSGHALQANVWRVQRLGGPPWLGLSMLIFQGVLKHYTKFIYKIQSMGNS